jgi:hypothetical protein
MEIRTSGNSHTYAPVGRCIYCDSRKSLTREHIIPFGLGGNRVLPESSCPECQKLTGNFEQSLLRGHFFPARVHLGFPTRHNDPRPDAFPMRFTDDGSEVVLPLADHPCVLYLPKFVNEPAILTGTEPTGKIEAGMWLYVFQPDLHRRASQFGARPVEPRTAILFGDFLRLLAKIGHAYATAELGIGSFKPLAVGVIEGETAKPDLLIGGMRDTLQPKSDFHDLWLAKHQSRNGTFWIANVQLFASLQGPIYRVVVGEAS